MSSTEFISDREIYDCVIRREIPQAEQFLWLGTSDIKDLYVNKGTRMAPFLEVLAELVDHGVQVRLLHAKEPGPAFRKDFDRYPGLIDGVERVLCPRIHFKSVVVDGRFAYSGSANLTGAGMGAKGIHKRNFESGFVTTDPTFVNQIMTQFDEVWMGAHCDGCKRKQYCTDLGALSDTS